MSRELCSTCKKPLRSCICEFFCEINNSVKVVLLQHESETGQMKGTAPLLTHSLSSCETIIGEDFTQNAYLNALIDDDNQKVCLLYPSEQASNIDKYSASLRDESSGKSITLLLIDATWKKAYRMYMLSHNLHSLTHLSLAENLIGQYAIRKTKKKNALSTLEACAYALSVLEDSPEKYQQLFDNFVAFNQFQLSFRLK